MIFIVQNPLLLRSFERCGVVGMDSCQILREWSSVSTHIWFDEASKETCARTSLEQSSFFFHSCYAYYAFHIICIPHHLQACNDKLEVLSFTNHLPAQCWKHVWYEVCLDCGSTKLTTFSQNQLFKSFWLVCCEGFWAHKWRSFFRVPIFGACSPVYIFCPLLLSVQNCAP